MMKKSMETLLDELVQKSGQAQICRMFRNSAQDAGVKLAELEKEIQKIRAAIMEQS